MLEPVVPRYRGRVKRLYFRGDAAFANPVIYEFLKAEDMRYAIRISAFLLLCRFQHFWKSQVSTTAATRGVMVRRIPNGVPIPARTAQPPGSVFRVSKTISSPAKARIQGNREVPDPRGLHLQS